MKRRQTQDRLSSYQKRFRSTYLALVFLLLVFIVIFSFLVRQRIKGILGHEDDSETPTYEVFPYHSLAETTWTKAPPDSGETLTEESQPTDWTASQESGSGLPATTGRPAESRPAQGGTSSPQTERTEATGTTLPVIPSTSEGSEMTESTLADEAGSEHTNIQEPEESASSEASPEGGPVDGGDPGGLDAGGGEEPEEKGQEDD